jgi:hypothetical protein
VAGFLKHDKEPSGPIKVENVFISWKTQLLQKYSIPWIILSRVWVTIDRICIGNWIYWTLTDHNYQFTSTIATSHTPQFTTVRTKSSPVVTWWRIPTVFSSYMLTFLPAGDCPTTNSSNCPAYNISARTVQKTQFLCCCSIVA